MKGKWRAFLGGQAVKLLALVLACSAVLAGCAISGGISAQRFEVRDNEISVSGTSAGGTVACGLDPQPPCEAMPVF
jgi:ABC-type uncharacterized transport system auxiliary subunit